MMETTEAVHKPMSVLDGEIVIRPLHRKDVDLNLLTEALIRMTLQRSKAARGAKSPTPSPAPRSQRNLSSDHPLVSAGAAVE